MTDLKKQKKQMMGLGPNQTTFKSLPIHIEKED